MFSEWINEERNALQRDACLTNGESNTLYIYIGVDQEFAG